MKIAIKLVLVFVIVNVSVGILGYVVFSQSTKISESLTNAIPTGINEITRTSELDSLAQFIRYYDEVLTQSARNYAFTEDRKWEERYMTVEPELDKIIKEAISKGDEKDRQFFSDVDSANMALVKMEYKSIELVNNGQMEEAIKVLESSEYWDQKKIYENGLKEYVTRRGEVYDKVLVIHTQELESITKESQNLLRNSTDAFSVIILFILTISTGLAIIIIQNISKPINDLKLASEEIAKGNFDNKINSQGDDEISSLARSFNLMSDSLKNAINDLVTTEKKFKDLYNSSPELLRTINTKGILTDCNDTYANILGYSKNEIIGTSIFDHTAEKSLDALQNSLESWRKEGLVRNRDIWMKRKDGTTFSALLSAASIFDEKGNLIGSNTVIRDMSEIYLAKKEIEEEKTKRLSAIGELSARIAHDLRNPLSVIKNTIDILKILHPDFDEKTISQLARLERAALRMSHQIDEVLDYVSPKPLQLSNNSISEVLNSTMDRIVVPDKIKISLPQKDVSITCDAEKMEAVFANLITNAIQAMSNEGNIDIRILEQIDHVIIEVEDSGPGIRDDVLPKIFDPLFTTRQVGTGLGLVSCKSIIEKHGGSLLARTQLGKGTTFVITLPKNHK